MYKKIKNGSFINWVWFFICIIPFIVFIVAFVGDNKEFTFGKKEIDQTYENLLFDDTLINNVSLIQSQSGATMTLNENGSYTIEWVNTDAVSNVISLDIMYNNYETDLYIDFMIYDVDFSSQQWQPRYSYSIVDGNPPPVSVNIDANEQVNILPNSYGSANLGIIAQFPYDTLSVSYKIGVFITKDEIASEMVLPLDDYNNFYTYKTSKGSLEEFEESLKTNGFISSAFLNLSSFFGVNNVYYSLACYYIEYLLVIVLLHLAFDVLYILPNICHKFMEKIGGERD